VLLQAPSVHIAEKYSDSQETEVSRWRASLIYQLVTSRIVRHLEALLARLDPACTPEEMQQTVSEGLDSLLRRFGAGATPVTARLSASQERSGYSDLHLRITPGPSIWPLPVDVDLNIPVRGV
jgi:hypothetical protein